MKHYFITLAVSVACCTAHAQLREGRMVAIGNGSYDRSDLTQSYSTPGKQRDTRENAYVALRYGFMVNERFMIGAYGDYQWSSFNNSNSNNSNPNNPSFTNTFNGISNVYSGGFFLRRYQVLSKDGRLAVFMQASAGYSQGKSKSISGTEMNGMMNKSEGRSELTKFSVSLNPGITYFLNDWLAMEASFGNLSVMYQQSKNYTANYYLNTVAITQLGISAASSSFNIGFNVYFGGRKNAPALQNKG